MPPPARLLTILAIVIPVGFGTLLYKGPGADWVEGYGGALCYEVFWVLALKACLPRASVMTLAVAVFLATSEMEFLQLSGHPWLEWLRSFYLGRVFIGAVFDPWDFLYYAIGSAVAVVLYRSVVGRDKIRP